jgi:CBS domain-containing protein
MVPTVRSAMTSCPVVVFAESPATEVERLFDRHRFNVIPVVDADGRVLGLVSQRSFLRLAERGEAGVFERPRRARDMMDPRLACVTPDDPLTRAIDRMIRSRLRSLPVVDASHRRLVGIVSRGDVLHRLSTDPHRSTAA